MCARHQCIVIMVDKIVDKMVDEIVDKPNKQGKDVMHTSEAENDKTCE